MSFPASIQLPGLTLDPRWYRRSVFYEVMVRSFVDSNADGTGDLAGLISKLDYLQWLGIDALWLPPFYTSPLRDGGYDVSDYRTILPEFGTLDEFQELVTKAHERNMRIVIDLPFNHTSDQHEWFQQSRQDPLGPFGDFYVWSDTDVKYQNIRIIFTDTEESMTQFSTSSASGYQWAWTDFVWMRCRICTNPKRETVKASLKPTSFCGNCAPWWMKSSPAEQ